MRWLVCLWVVAIVVGTARAGSGSYKLLNQVLGGLHVDIDTSQVPPINKDIGLKNSITVSFAKAAKCEQFSVGDVSVGGRLGTDKFVDQDGTQFDQYQVELDVTKIGFQCSIGVCIETHTIFGTKTDCDGTVTITSTKSHLATTEAVLSRQFGHVLPSKVAHVNKPCSEAVTLDGITFSGHNLVEVVGIDITKVLVDLLNGRYKDDALNPIRDALCDVLPEMAKGLEKMLLEAPWSDFINDQDLNNDTEPLHLEKEIHASLPDNVALIDLGENFLTNLVFPDHDDGNLVINQDTIKTIVSKAGIVLPPPQQESSELPLALELMEAFLPKDFDLRKSMKEKVDILKPLQELVSNNEEITLTLDLLDVGKLNLTLKGLALEIDPPSSSSSSASSSKDSLTLKLIGQQTLGLPPIDLDRVMVVADIHVVLDINFKVMDQTLAFRLDETPSVAIDWTGFVFQSGLLLAVDQSRIEDLELGPVYRNIMDCALSTFYRPPTITDTYADGKDIDITVSRFTDGLSNIVGDLFKTIFPVYRGLLPDVVRSLSLKELDGMELVKTMTCPTLSMDEQLAKPFNFSSTDDNFIGFLTQNYLNKNMVNEVINAAFPNKDDRTITVLSDRFSVAELDMKDLGGKGTFKIELLKIDVIFKETSINEFDVLKTSSPSQDQNLHNGADLTTLKVEARVAVSLQHENKVKIEWDVNEISAVVDLLATLSKFDVEAKRLGKAIFLDCWLADLDPYGGVTDLGLIFKGNKVAMSCIDCPNPLFHALSEKISDPASLEPLFNAIEKGKENLFNRYLRRFTPTFWNETITNAHKRCRGEQVLVASDNYHYQPNHPDIDAHVFPVIATLVSIVALAAICTLPCVRRTRKLNFKQEILVPMLNTSLRTTSDDDDIVFTGEDEETITTVQPVERTMVENDTENKGAMWNHEKLSMSAKVLVPFLIFCNLCLFLMGHMDVVMRIHIQGQLIGSEFAMNNIAEFSILTSTKEMWKSGAKALASLIVLLSICWPYIKLVSLAILWFSPSKLISVKRRGSSITTLDRLGKWSLLELYVVAFVLVTFNIRVDSPMVDAFLPPGLLNVAVVVEPAYSLYTFTSALILSLILGNIFLLLQHHIEGHDHHEQFIHASGEDKPLSVADMLYLQNSNLRKSTLYTQVLAGLTCFSIVVTLIASGIVTIIVDLIGVLPTTFGTISHLQTSHHFSLFSFAAAVFQQGELGDAYFGTAMVMTVLIIPLAQLGFLVYLISQKHTLNQAIRWQLCNHVISAWCATEALILGFVLVVLEIATLSQGLIASQCDGIMPFFFNVGLPVGLVAEHDIDDGCLTMTGTVQYGAYIFLVAVFLSNMANILITRAFDSYVVERKHRTLHHNIEEEESEGLQFVNLT